MELGDLIGNGERLTIAYADARAKRTVASSAFEPGKWWTLGQAFEVSGDAQMPSVKLACALDGNTLVPIPIIPPSASGFTKAPSAVATGTHSVAPEYAGTRATMSRALDNRGAVVYAGLVAHQPAAIESLESAAPARPSRIQTLRYVSLPAPRPLGTYGMALVVSVLWVLGLGWWTAGTWTQLAATFGKIGAAGSFTIDECQTFYGGELGVSYECVGRFKGVDSLMPSQRMILQNPSDVSRPRGARVAARLVDGAVYEQGRAALPSSLCMAFLVLVLLCAPPVYGILSVRPTR
jgi:hypothetical protein